MSRSVKGLSVVVALASASSLACTRAEAPANTPSVVGIDWHRPVRDLARQQLERSKLDPATGPDVATDADVWEGLEGSNVGEAFGVGGLGLVGVGYAGHGVELVDGHLVLTDADGNRLEPVPGDSAAAESEKHPTSRE